MAPVPPAPDGFADAFTASLLSNLAPLLTLFGEQISKQFLAQATSLADSIIFATVPVGILSAVVSAVRLGGNKLLRTIVGRRLHHSIAVTRPVTLPIITDKHLGAEKVE